MYYDVSQPVTISCDASQVAVLLQNSKCVAYVSRTLTDAQIRYAQIEKELLAVVFIGVASTSWLGGGRQW